MGTTRIPAWLCAKCKGYKHLCGLPECPLLERFRAQLKTLSSLGNLTRLEASTPPSAIVSEKHYPRIAVLYNLPPGVRGDDARIYDDPEGWWGRLDVKDVLRLRSSLVASLIRVDARRPDELYSREISLAAVSSKPVDSEAVLGKPPRPRLRLDGVVTPVGLSAPAKSIRVSENPRIPRPLDKAMYDYDAKAREAVVELYRAGVNYYTLIRALSLGLLGSGKRRRLVPTRWAITAVDSIISSYLRGRLAGKPWINGVESYHAEYLGNRFIIILYPGPPAFEWIEAWHPLTPWIRGGKVVVITNRENWRGAFQYMDGGYIAARMAVLEALARRGRQASAIILREVTSKYYAPLGNWHIRETVKHAMEKKPSKHEGIAEALNHASKMLEADLNSTLNELKHRLEGQRKIVDWF